MDDKKEIKEEEEKIFDEEETVIINWDNLKEIIKIYK